MPENVLNSDHVDVKFANCKLQNNNEEHDEPNVHFEPIISLPLIEVSNNEEDELEMLKLRAKLYRYDTSNNPAEWKERGTGEVKLLRHTTKNTVRVVMRRDKTFKICANHFITPWMELKPNCGSDKAWIWSVLADYADEQLKPELLAIHASMWKETFEKAKKIVGSECEIYAGKNNSRQEHVKNNSKSISNINLNESINCKDQTKLSEPTEECEATSQEKEIEEKVTMAEKKDIKNEENILIEILKLKVKDEDEDEKK
ncbi:hypothetical protein DMN91_003518 [Ooceraea biroi]|uniref:Ran-specific GTPase-activating protein n=1 Tax=Ooceraea biroi TaxID=2015173 RepID=A0A3L8DSC7_OOCBI|nr:hypothetical protein DMN91_003518 [Ooceraea biroi]